MGTTGSTTLSQATVAGNSATETVTVQSGTGYQISTTAASATVIVTAFCAGDTVHLYRTLDPHDDRGRHLLVHLPGKGRLGRAPTPSLPRDGSTPRPSTTAGSLRRSPPATANSEVGGHSSGRGRPEKSPGTQLINRAGFHRELRRRHAAQRRDLQIGDQEEPPHRAARRSSQSSSRGQSSAGRRHAILSKRAAARRARRPAAGKCHRSCGTRVEALTHQVALARLLAGPHSADPHFSQWDLVRDQYCESSHSQSLLVQPAALVLCHSAIATEH